MSFEPTGFPAGAPVTIEECSGAQWSPVLENTCSFSPDIFLDVMTNLIRNPNINSSWLFRADILTEYDAPQDLPAEPPNEQLQLLEFRDFRLVKALVRRLIPRNTLRDQPLDQTCLYYHGVKSGDVEQSMIVYNPHLSAACEVPFYHPKVRGLAFLHEWDPSKDQGKISIHYCYFPDVEKSSKLDRTALSLLSMLHKHGEGTKAGYKKRVHHDTIIPQAAVQNTYARLKESYARQLLDSWAEVTDPSKHVFEDLGIAAFLIELWKVMYDNAPFPGFVDIGCGNGLLVYVLRSEGYSGWGFDARKRKSWTHYTMTDGPGVTPSLRQQVLLPSVVVSKETSTQMREENIEETGNADMIHDGLFPKGTFIISNHADELTPWTPILGAASQCPFIMIPCCSHDLSGARYRAPPPKGQDKSASAYSSLVNWVSQIADECGWEVETEMLRIPSTRNTGLIGRQRSKDFASIDLQQIIAKYGGTEGYTANVMKLVKSAPRGH